MRTRNPARYGRRAAPLACTLLLAIAAAASAQTEIADQASVAAKRARSPVDPRLAVWAGAQAQAGARALREVPPPDAWPLIVRPDGIVIDAASNGDPHALLAELEAIGLREGAVAGNAVSGVLPFAAIDALATCRSLAVARPAMVTTSHALAERGRPDRSRGSVTSQGVAAMRVDRLPRSIDGAGTSVGIVADSFDCIAGGREQDTASGDLPADVVILDDSNRASCLDEGRALAQVVHDVAPRSRLGFHTGFNGQADFAQAIGELAREFGADVIVDDVLYFDEPFFQDGPISRAVDEVHDQGVTFVSAAGNSGRRSYEAPFRDSGQTGFYQEQTETRRHDFDPGPGVDVFQTVTLPPFAETILIFQWNEPFVSASTASPPVGAASDYDLMVYVTETPRPLDFRDVFARSDAFNPGGDAFEGLVLRNPGATPLDVYVAIERYKLPGFDGPDVDRMRVMDFGFRIASEWSTGGGGTAFGHVNARGAVAVGAAAWFETPRFGVSPPLVEPFSSAGGVPILLDGAGQPLPAPVLRETPDIVAPDGVNTTFFGAPSDIPQDDDAFPNFFGSSASAPHVAGVVALLQGQVRGGTAVVDDAGALRALRMCFVWKGRRFRIPHTFEVAPDQVPDALAAGARLGPCWARRPRQLERLLERSAVDMAAPGYDLDTGHGLIDARAALRGLLSVWW